MSGLEEFARLKMEFDNKRSLTWVQLFAIAVSGLVLILFLGFVSLFLGGLVVGTIFASAISTIVILGAVDNMRNRNISDFLEAQEFEKEETGEKISAEDTPGDSARRS